MRFIDPHLHLWDTAVGEYGWLKAHDDLPLSITEQTVGEPHLRPDAYVHIEAGFDNKSPWRELAWLENTCTQPFRAVAGIVLTLPSDEFLAVLSHHQQCSFCVGVRHILDEQAAEILSLPQAQKNLALVAQHDLLFEAQFFVQDTSVTKKVAKLLKANPSWRWVINHAGYAPENQLERDGWLQNIQLLAKCSNLSMKCSGFELVARDFKWSNAHAIISECITAFGQHRVMLASNFPLLSWRMTYAEYWHELTQMYRETPELFYDNANRIYFNATLPPRAENV